MIVCDVEPVAGETTSHYEVTMPDGTSREMDLCDRHAEPIQALMRKLGSAPEKATRKPASAPASKRTTARQVRTAKAAGSAHPAAASLKALAGS